MPENLDLHDSKIRELFLNREKFIAYYQSLLDYHDQNKRLVYRFINQLGDHLTNAFFVEYLDDKSPEEEENLIEKWVHFYDGLKRDKIALHLSQINAMLTDVQKNKEKVIEELRQIYKLCTAEYSKEFSEPKNEFPVENLLQELHKQFNPPLLLPTASKTYANWDPSHSGQNVVYHKPFARTRAWINGKASLRELFFSNDHDVAANKGCGFARPEWEAWRNKQRGLFANTRASFNTHLNSVRTQLNREIDRLHAAVLREDAYQQSAEQLFHQIGIFITQADQKNLELTLETVKQVTDFIEGKKPYRI